jgi:hypothetical protein
MWFFGFGVAAAVFAIMQAVDGARRKRAAAIASGAVPPTPAPPAAPVPPVPAEEGPGEEPYREHIVHSILGGWSPFYSFLVAVAMFSLGAITSSQIPKMSEFSMNFELYAVPPSATVAPVTPANSASPGQASSTASLSAPTPAPTPKAVKCKSTLSAPAAFTVGGSAIVHYHIDCDGPGVLQPDVTPHIGVGTTTATPSNLVSKAVANADRSSYEWQWVIGAPQGPSSPQPAFESGVDTVLYVTLSPNSASPTQNIPGTTTPVVIRGRTTFASLTAVVQGLSGFIGAFIALLAGIANFVKRGATPT